MQLLILSWNLSNILLFFPFWFDIHQIYIFVIPVGLQLLSCSLILPINFLFPFQFMFLFPTNLKRISLNILYQPQSFLKLFVVLLNFFKNRQYRSRSIMQILSLRRMISGSLSIDLLQTILSSSISWYYRQEQRWKDG